jgi:hypothetical protein
LRVFTAKPFRRCHMRVVIVMKSRARLSLFLAFLPAVSLAATEPKIDHYVRLTPENSAIGNFPAQKAPILTVKSGAVVKVDTGGGAGWRNPKVDPNEWLKQNGVPTTLETNPALRRTAHTLWNDGAWAGTQPAPAR